MITKKSLTLTILALGTGVGIALGLGAGQSSSRSVVPAAMGGADVAAGAKWGACINIQATENSDVFEFLSQAIAHERLATLAEKARQEWSVDLDSLETVTLYGADDDWGKVTLVVRGDFSDVDFTTVEQEQASPRHGRHTIHRCSPVENISLWFAKYSDGVLVGAETVEAVERALDVLDGVQPSYAQVADQPEIIRTRFASSDCVIGLNIEALKNELDLESEILAGTSQAWFTVRDEGDTVRASLIMDHSTGEAASQAVSNFEELSRLALSTETTPSVIAELLESLSIETDGNWLTASADGDSEDVMHFLKACTDCLMGHRADKVVDHPADGELVFRWRAGSSSAFEALVFRHQPRLLNFLQQRLGNREDAEDVTQRVFVTIHQEIDRYRDEYSFATWLFMIARRQAIDFQRRSGSRRRTWQRFHSLANHDDVETGNPADAMDQRERAGEIWKWVRAQLGERAFTVLWLNIQEEMDDHQIARVMKLTRTHVRVILHRARGKLIKFAMKSERDTGKAGRSHPSIAKSNLVRHLLSG